MNGPTIYHVTPITPNAALEQLAGRAMMLRWGRHDQWMHVERLAPFICYENGAYDFFRRGVEVSDWSPFYAWLEERLFLPGRWAIIPDVIGAGVQLQDALLREWPFGHRGAPVWHTDEPIDRLERLVEAWPRVCIGSTGDTFEIWQSGFFGRRLSEAWKGRMDQVWDLLGRRRHIPAVHMLRGTGVARLYPFASADSSSVGKNGHRYRSPLFNGVPELEHAGLVAYADRLERGEYGAA